MGHLAAYNLSSQGRFESKHNQHPGQLPRILLKCHVWLQSAQVLTSGCDSRTNSLTLGVAAGRKHFAGIWLELSWLPLLLALLVQPQEGKQGVLVRFAVGLKTSGLAQPASTTRGAGGFPQTGLLTKPLIRPPISVAGCKARLQHSDRNLICRW